MQKSIDDAVASSYKYKHKPVLRRAELQVLESFPVGRCRYCGSESFVKNGRTPDGLQKHLCKSCGRVFTVLSGTLFDSHKIPISEWMDFLRNIFSCQSFESTSKNNRNSSNTTRYWFGKVLLVLRGYQDGTILSGQVWLDETYYTVVRSQEERKSDGSEYRGLSRNKYCIGVAVTENMVYCAVEGKRGKPSSETTWDCFKDHIAPGSLLVHDGDASHRKLVRELHLAEEVHTTKETKGLSDDENPLEPVNSAHRFLKYLLRAHSGLNRFYLPDYMNLFAFMENTPSDPNRKIEILIKLIFANPKLLRYRDKIPE